MLIPVLSLLPVIAGAFYMTNISHFESEPIYFTFIKLHGAASLECLAQPTSSAPTAVDPLSGSGSAGQAQKAGLLGEFYDLFLELCLRLIYN